MFFINRSNANSVVADAFADSFETVFFDSNISLGAKNEFEQLLASELPHHTVDKREIFSMFSVDQIDRGIRLA